MAVSQRFVRARQPAQKELRRQQLLDATTDLLRREGFDNCSLSQIARATGVAKSNIYRYFESREDIFLTLLVEDFALCIQRVLEVLSPLEGSDDVGRVAGLLGDVFCEFPRMCLLMSVLDTILVNNVSDARLTEAVAQMDSLRQHFNAVMRAALPGMKTQDLQTVMQTNTAFIAGLSQTVVFDLSLKKMITTTRHIGFDPRTEAALKAGIALIVWGAYHQS